MYTIKPDTGTGGITLTRRGDTAMVIDTSANTIGVDTVSFAPSDVVSVEPSPSDVEPPAASPGTVRGGAASPPGLSAPAVTASDLIALRVHAPRIPVLGVKADDLVDSFDDIRGGTRRHEAIDIMAPRGTPVVSVDAGRVLKLHNSVAGGLSLYVADPTQRFIMLYAHLDSYRQGLTPGMDLRKGDVVGYVGSTGNASPAAPHLHFAIARSDNPKEWWKGTPLNPFLIWRGK